MAVKWDILFYQNLITSHIIYEAIRSSVASVLPGKSATEFIKAVENGCVRIFGRPKLAVGDGETRQHTEEVRQWLGRLPSESHPKALGEHATTVERHYERLRDPLH